MADELTQVQMEKLEKALVNGSKIDAIKIYREATGRDLKDSKEAVEALIDELMARDPRKYARLTAKGAGCASVILLGVGLAVFGVARLIESLA